MHHAYTGNGLVRATIKCIPYVCITRYVEDHIDVYLSYVETLCQNDDMAI